MIMMVLSQGCHVKERLQMKRLKNVVYINTYRMEYLTMRKNILPTVTTCMKLEVITPSKKSHIKKTSDTVI